jgi:hypothetical protein
MPYEAADVDDSAYFDGQIALKAIDYLQKFKKDNKPFFLEGESLVGRLSSKGKTENDYAICKWDNGLTYIENNYFFPKWYDHTIDPEENINLSANPEYTEIIHELSVKLRERRTDNCPSSQLPSKHSFQISPGFPRHNMG